MHPKFTAKNLPDSLQSLVGKAYAGHTYGLLDKIFPGDTLSYIVYNKRTNKVIYGDLADELAAYIRVTSLPDSLLIGYISFLSERFFDGAFRYKINKANDDNKTVNEDIKQGNYLFHSMSSNSSESQKQKLFKYVIVKGVVQKDDIIVENGLGNNVARLTLENPQIVKVKTLINYDKYFDKKINIVEIENLIKLKSKADTIFINDDTTANKIVIRVPKNSKYEKAVLHLTDYNSYEKYHDFNADGGFRVEMSEINNQVQIDFNNPSAFIEIMNNIRMVFQKNREYKTQGFDKVEKGTYNIILELNGEIILSKKILI